MDARRGWYARPRSLPARISAASFADAASLADEEASGEEDAFASAAPAVADPFPTESSLPPVARASASGRPSPRLPRSPSAPRPPQTKAD